MKLPDQTILGKQETVNLKELQKFVSDLEDFNKQHHWGVMAAEALTSSMGAKIKEKTAPEEVIQKNHTFLEKTGLTIESIKRKDIVMFSSRNKDSRGKRPSEMRINIADSGNFNKFLDSVKAEQLTQEYIESLKFITKSLIEQIKTEYDLENPEEDRLFNLFAGLEKIIKNYKRLDSSNKNGLAESVQKLEKYLETSRDEYLKEYLIAENGSYLPMADENLGKREAGFTLSNWQGDSTPDSYENLYWQKAFNALDKIKENPKASKFFSEILSYFKKCAIYGRKSIIERNAEYPEKIVKDLAEEAKDSRIHRSEKDPKVLIENMKERTKLLIEALDRIENKLDSY